MHQFACPRVTGARHDTGAHVKPHAALLKILILCVDSQYFELYNMGVCLLKAIHAVDPQVVSDFTAHRGDFSGSPFFYSTHRSTPKPPIQVKHHQHCTKPNVAWFFALAVILIFFSLLFFLRPRLLSEASNSLEQLSSSAMAAEPVPLVNAKQPRNKFSFFSTVAQKRKKIKWQQHST